MPGARPVPLPCRLEEQTRRLQKDMKKSTDADLGRWHSPDSGQDRVGPRWMPSSLSHLRAGFEISALTRYPTDVPEVWLEVTLHLQTPTHRSSRAQQQPPQLGGVLASVVCATEPQARPVQRTWARLGMTALAPGLQDL